MTEKRFTGGDMLLLEKNLEAIVKTNPKMVQRIAWPVDGRHVELGDDGAFYYRLHSSLYPLSVKEQEVVNTTGCVNGDNQVFVFGVGLGEQVDYLLERYPEKGIVAWDRDPWLVRLLLMNKDYSEHLRSGRLRILMCGDLIARIKRGGEKNVVYHPLFKELYKNEAGLLASGIGERHVLVNAEGLFVDDIADALKDFGYTPFYLNMNRISIGEIERTIVQFMPAFVFSINYYSGLGELCEKFDLRLLCWEIDPCLESVPKARAINEKSHIFTYRKKNVVAFQSAGFINAQYLPLGANCQGRKPVDLSPDEKKKYESRVSFVGSSMAENSHRLRNRFRDMFAEFDQSGMRGFSKGEKVFNDIMQVQRKDFSRYTIPEAARAMCGEFLEHATRVENARIDPVKLLGEVAASEKRLAYVSALGKYEIKVWGDEHWTAIGKSGGIYMGFAGHKHELNKIYSGSRINVDINRLYQSDMVNMRIFDVLACGGFVLAEHSKELEELFELDKEVVTYRNLAELLNKIDYYLAHPEERQLIAYKGMQAVRERHTIKSRVQEMLGFIE